MLVGGQRRMLADKRARLISKCWWELEQSVEKESMSKHRSHANWDIVLVLKYVEQDSLISGFLKEGQYKSSGISQI